MKRADLEKLQAELTTRYAEQLVREQPHLAEHHALMCTGFAHGLGWLVKVLETAGLKLEDGPEVQWVCEACRKVSPADHWVIPHRPYDRACPHCLTLRAVRA